MLNLILYMILGSTFFCVLGGFNIQVFLIGLGISVIGYMILKPPSLIKFIMLIASLVISIPKTIYESIMLLRTNSESIYHVKTKDAWDSLKKILTITLTPLTIVMNEEENELIIHKRFKK